jgi:hypothetical protein
LLLVFRGWKGLTWYIAMISLFTGHNAQPMLPV